MDALRAGRLARRGILLAAWLTATGALGTCDYFRPAVPEPPSEPPIIPDYKNPTATLETIAKGVEAKGLRNGVDVYMGAFADCTFVGGDGRAFHAFFDTRDLRDFLTWDPATDWDRGYESRMYPKLVTEAGNPYRMSWEPYEPGGIEDGSADDSLVHRKYRIIQITPAGPLPIAIGAADLYFVRSAASRDKWVIARWQDFRSVGADSAQITLGHRRLEFR